METGPLLAHRVWVRRAAGIVAVLALAGAVALPEYQRHRQAADDHATRQILQALHWQELLHHQAHGTYARLDALRAAGKSPVGEGDELYRHLYTSTASATGFVIVARPTDAAGTAYTMDARGRLNAPPDRGPRPLTQAERLSRARQHARAHPTDASAWIRLAALLGEANRREEALVAARRAARLDPKRAAEPLLDALLDRADEMCRSGRPAKALLLLREAMALNSRDSDVHALTGEAQRLLGQLGAAAASFTRATRLQPLSARAWYGLARVREAQGKRQVAAHCYLRVLDISYELPVPQEWTDASLRALERLRPPPQ